MRLERDDKSGTPLTCTAAAQVCVCVCARRVAGVQVECRDGVPARRRRVESNRTAPSERTTPGWQQLGCRRAAPRRADEPRGERDPRSASCTPFLTPFRLGLPRSVTRKCLQAGSTLRSPLVITGRRGDGEGRVARGREEGGCLNITGGGVSIPPILSVSSKRDAAEETNDAPSSDTGFDTFCENRASDLYKDRDIRGRYTRARKKIFRGDKFVNMKTDDCVIKIDGYC